MSLSDSSALSSPPSSGDEAPVHLSKKDGILKFFSKERAASPGSSSDEPPASRKRQPSPPHEYVLADHPDIAVVVMFRSRFNEAFPKSLAHYGPQDIERGIVDTLPSEQVENLLCALMGLALNRKKYPERAHYQRPLEEAVQTHSSQWPSSWNGKNPLHGGKTFSNMSPTERLSLLKALVLWALCSSEAVQALLRESYKQARHDDDLNQPLSVQPWGLDGDKRRYWLIEGRDDTDFRLYRESNIKLVRRTWRSVAGSIQELREVGQRLDEEGSQAARRLSERIMLAIPRFEATEEKRKRREYRIARKAQFTRTEPGFSLYEGRTRGKRIRYTYSSDEGEGSDATSTRRSGRQSGIATPAEGADGPTFTASGRQVRSRHGGTYGETITGGRDADWEAPAVGGAGGISGAEEPSEGTDGRPRRSGLRQEVEASENGAVHIAGYNSVDEMEEEEDAASSGAEDYAGDYEGDDDVKDEETEGEVSDDNSSIAEGQVNGDDPSLVVQLRYRKNKDGDIGATRSSPSAIGVLNPVLGEENIPLPNGHANQNGTIHEPRQPSEPQPYTSQSAR
ncbi:MAG: hypothetical protein M1833_000061 [Piccolia ochrophora]|nr:MAG: hypothetical protein M1833_000061 [Piccolia ochrophora]